MQGEKGQKDPRWERTVVWGQAGTFHQSKLNMTLPYKRNILRSLQKLPSAFLFKSDGTTTRFCTVSEAYQILDFILKKLWRWVVLERGFIPCSVTMTTMRLIHCWAKFNSYCNDLAPPSVHMNTHRHINSDHKGFTACTQGYLWQDKAAWTLQLNPAGPGLQLGERAMNNAPTLPLCVGVFAAVPVAPGDIMCWSRLWPHRFNSLTWPLGLNENPGQPWPPWETWPGHPVPLRVNCTCYGHFLPCPVLELTLVLLPLKSTPPCCFLKNVILNLFCLGW